MDDDFYANKIAFVTALNFPFYSLDEKTKLGDTWTRKQWAYARMGDRFTSRIPAQVQQHLSQTLTNADSYISNYNIYMGQLVDAKGENSITVASGANGSLSIEEINKASLVFHNGDILLTQLETPIETVAHAVETASLYGLKSILNPAPAAKLPEDIFRNLFA